MKAADSILRRDGETRRGARASKLSQTVGEGHGEGGGPREGDEGEGEGSRLYGSLRAGSGIPPPMDEHPHPIQASRHVTAARRLSEGLT